MCGRNCIENSSFCDISINFHLMFVIARLKHSVSFVLLRGLYIYFRGMYPEFKSRSEHPSNPLAMLEKNGVLMEPLWHLWEHYLMGLSGDCLPETTFWHFRNVNDQIRCDHQIRNDQLKQQRVRQFHRLRHLSLSSANSSDSTYSSNLGTNGLYI